MERHYLSTHTVSFLHAIALHSTFAASVAFLHLFAFHGARSGICSVFFRCLRTRSAWFIRGVPDAAVSGCVALPALDPAALPWRRRGWRRSQDDAFRLRPIAVDISTPVVVFSGSFFFLPAPPAVLWTAFPSPYFPKPSCSRHFPSSHFVVASYSGVADINGDMGLHCVQPSMLSFYLLPTVSALAPHCGSASALPVLLPSACYLLTYLSYKRLLFRCMPFFQFTAIFPPPLPFLPSSATLPRLPLAERGRRACCWRATCHHRTCHYLPTALYPRFVSPTRLRTAPGCATRIL